MSERDVKNRKRMLDVSTLRPPESLGRDGSANININGTEALLFAFPGFIMRIALESFSSSSQPKVELFYRWDFHKQNSTPIWLFTNKT